MELTNTINLLFVVPFIVGVLLVIVAPVIASNLVVVVPFDASILDARDLLVI